MWVPTLTISLLSLCMIPKSFMHPRRLLMRSWMATRFYLLLEGMHIIVFVVCDDIWRAHNDKSSMLTGTMRRRELLRPLLPAAIVMILCALPMSHFVRGRIHATFGKLGKTDDELQLAAAAAVWASRRSVGSLLDLATQRFRTVTLADALDHFTVKSDAEEEGRAERHTLSRHTSSGSAHPHMHTPGSEPTGIPEDGRDPPAANPARLGEGDAFVSHSKSDRVALKHHALQLWDANRPTSSEEPRRVWVDDLCLDHNAIVADLVCLPLFLYGCKELIALVGLSFPTRLWCIWEVFTFIQITGPGTRNIVVYELEEGTRPLIDEVDIFKAQCWLEDDRQSILAAIETGFGDLREFDKTVRTILQEKLQPAMIDATGDTQRANATPRSELPIEIFHHGLNEVVAEIASA